jgi:hypothetical protein
MVFYKGRQGAGEESPAPARPALRLNSGGDFFLTAKLKKGSSINVF